MQHVPPHVQIIQQRPPLKVYVLTELTIHIGKDKPIRTPSPTYEAPIPLVSAPKPIWFLNRNPIKLVRYYVNGAGPSNMSPADFNDFTPFGRWTAPSVKQFVQGDQLCDVTVNRNIFDTQTPVGITLNKEKSNHIADGSLGVDSSTLIRRAEITA
ncbi:hypothetical protein GCK32_003321 [Trichostrongylus colubriformis]|uniref:Uncharacterized protein n=1 Tax=Trichostrongylus colubriformis TaxID=6319 RepID=A0AAN8IKF9_TRICO